MEAGEGCWGDRRGRVGALPMWGRSVEAEDGSGEEAIALARRAKQVACAVYVFTLKYHQQCH